MSDFPNGYLKPTYTGDVKGNSVNVDLFSISKFHEALKKYLKSQGLEYKDGEIVKTQRRIVAEAKEAIFDNEDERIRKEIIRILKGELGYTSKEDADKYIAWLERQGDCSAKWEKNTSDNKPTLNHSVLMKTTLGIAEGEWQGDYWLQYRWSCRVKDKNVLYWIELNLLDSDLPKEE